jgi:putative transcriptional regulator
MKNRDIGVEILRGIQEISTLDKGKKNLVIREFDEPLPVKTIRKNLKVSQFGFANLIGVSTRTIQDWEQGRRNPTGAAKSLLRIAEQKPEVFLSL